MTRKGSEAEVSTSLERQWRMWTKQLANLQVLRSIIQSGAELRTIHVHQFADASNLACSTLTIIVAKQDNETVRGLLISKSRISKGNTTIARLELIAGHMTASMVRNVCRALKEWPIASLTIWMDSKVALYWITNPEKPWKVFVANRVRTIAEITEETGALWKRRKGAAGSQDLNGC